VRLTFRGSPGDLARLWSRRWFAISFAAGLVLVLLPLLQSRVLPFHDSSGIVGLGGALALRDDPTARVRELYDLDIRPYPSALFFAWAWLAGAAGVPMDVAMSLFLAVFALAGAPLALLLLLDACHRPRHLALLAFPVAFHQQIWFGFLGSSAAITGLLLALAFARRMHDGVGWRRAVIDHAGLAAALVFVAAGHPFSLALALGAVAVLLLWPPAGARGVLPLGRAYLLRAAALVPTALFLGAWFAGFFGARTGGRSLITTVMVEMGLRAPRLADAPRFVEWLGDGYAGRWDEHVPLLALLTLIAFLAAGARAPRSAPRGKPPLAGGGPPPGGTPPPAAAGAGSPRAGHDLVTTVGLGWAAALLAAGYLFLPMAILWPEAWWGVRVRCVAPLYLVAVVLVRPRARGLPPWALAPAVAAGLGFLAFVSYDFAGHWGRRLDGFAEVIDAIPRGRSVLAMTDMPDPHYTRGHPYLIQHYVARKGGRAVPNLRGHPGSYWITMKEPPPSPPWGNPAEFRWELHGPGYDYFVLELPWQRPRPDPMATADPGAVEKVMEKGRFVLYRRVR
jgi:hypothetical protein